ncbi:MAG: conjugal transfer protein TraF [Candidatus Marinimicrobia bacterium]|jgi:hypothetical protein|nr:conjugal transfer protein TraF [Candidatus Neomarinimicrobiota bacterium]MCK9559406.1 conjugal transfer protein TraF [Candidatus Neomarinimicrobiota bacterium]MDD5061235.1 hypothetical protein [Candidatus Neomarinimicrobiota bacterium]
MHTFRKYSIVLMILIITWPFSGFAQQFYEVMSSEALRPFWSIYGFGSSSFTLMNNSRLATDISSTQSNPAFLTNIKRPKASFSGLSISPKNLTTLADVAKEYSVATTAYQIDYIGFAYPIPVYQGSFVLAASYMPANFLHSSSYSKGITGATFYDNDDNAHVLDTDLEYDTRETGSVNILRFAGATEFIKNFNLGLSFNIYSGERNYQSTEIGIDTYDHQDYNSLVYTENIKPSYSGFNLDFGLVYQSENYKFGLRLSTPINLKVHEVSELTYDYIYTDVDTLYYSDYDLKYKTCYPLEIAPNFAIKIGKISLGMDFIFHSWQKIEVDLLEEWKEVNRDLYWHLRNTTDIGASVAIPFGNSISTRLAYRLIPTPFAELEGTDEEYYQLFGAGVETILNKSIIVGCSYQRGFGNQSGFYRFFGTPVSQKHSEDRLSFSVAVLF